MVDPTGTEWEVSRRWLEIPRWRARRADMPADFPVFDGGGDDAGALVVSLVVVVLVVLLFTVGLPLLLFAAALVFAVGGLLLRILFGRPWLVEAASPATTRRWRVRGTIGSRRAMQEVAAAIARGDFDYEPRGAVRV